MANVSKTFLMTPLMKGDCGKVQKIFENAEMKERKNMICPFCGRESESDKRCTKCHVQFNKEIRSIAMEEDTRSDRIGPVSTKTAKRILWVFMAFLIILFVVLTETMAG